MIVRLSQQRDYRFTDETLLGIICKGRVLITEFVRECGTFYKIGDECIHRLRYLRFLTMKCRYLYISSVSVSRPNLSVSFEI